VKHKVTVLHHHVTEAFVEVANLWYLGHTQHFRKMIYFGANTIIIVRKFVRAELQLFDCVANAKDRI
jgi:hypothetical protein